MEEHNEPIFNKYTSIYNVDDEPKKFENIHNIIHNIKICINRGLHILRTPKDDFEKYVPYKQLIREIRDLDNWKILDVVNFGNELKQQLIGSIKSILYLFSDYNIRPSDLYKTNGSNNDYNKKEYYDNIYRINVLTNQILLTNILFLLEHKLTSIREDIQFDMANEIYELKLKNEEYDEKSNDLELLNSAYDYNIAQLTLENEEYDEQIKQLKLENNKHIEEIRRLNMNLMTIRTGYNTALRIKNIKENNYNIKFLKYYLKTLYHYLEQQKK
jgi:hypothetical protein